MPLLLAGHLIRLPTRTKCAITQGTSNNALQAFQVISYHMKSKRERKPESPSVRDSIPSARRDARRSGRRICTD